MSGHSKWATIKHKKAANDKARGKLFAKVLRQVEVAAREGGGDPDMNPTLRTMFQKARDNSVPLDTIERAVKRGTGELEGVTYESITYEGYAPNGVALLVEVLTDNRNRTGAEIRNIDLKDLRFATQRITSIEPGPGQDVYHAHVLPEERRNIRVYFDQPDINGKYIVRNDIVNGDPLGADYVKVHFKLPLAAPLMEDVYVYGGFSDFQCRKENRMLWSAQEKAYKAEILLKQGFYDFMYVTLPRNATSADITAIEGSHFQTENDYVIMVYFTDHQQRTDRLVGVRFLNSRRDG